MKNKMHCLCGHGETCDYCCSSTSNKNSREVSDKTLKKIEKVLNRTISSLLYGGRSGSPGFSELSGAAACFEVLQMLNLKIKSEKSVRRELEGDNVYEANFLKE